MLIQAINHFVYNTYLNRLLEHQSYKKYQKLLKITMAQSEPSKKTLPTRFVIFNFPRSGSNLLATMLNNHPDILCHNEIFNPKKIFYSKDFHELYESGKYSAARQDLISGKVGLARRLQRDLQPEKFLIEIWKHNYGASAVGLNLFPTHVPNMATSLLKDEAVKKILLIRKNKVKCYVSRAIARKTNSWSNYSNKPTQQQKATTTVYINADRLLNWSQKYDQYFESLRQKMTMLGQSYLEVAYEDLVGSRSTETKTKLLNFIEVPAQVEALQPLNKKQNSNSLTQLIDNFDELKRNLEGTSLESYIL